MSDDIPDDVALDLWEKFICSSVDLIVRDCDRSRAEPAGDLYQNYVTLIKVVAETSGLDRCDRQKVSDWSKNFDLLVARVMRLLDAMILRRGAFEFVQDMYVEECFSVRATSPDEINWHPHYLPSFFRVVGPSKCPEEFGRSAFVKVLRYVSMLYAFNENCRIVFGLDRHLGPAPLIPRERFVSEVLNIIVDIDRDDDDGRDLSKKWDSLELIAGQYPFLIPIRTRKKLLRQRLNECYHPSDDEDDGITAVFTMPRQNSIEEVALYLESFSETVGYLWDFKIEGELACGPGPTKEFYTIFSRDSQRHDLGLWTGEPSRCADGLICTSAKGGLFPSPNVLLSAETERILVSVGLIMAKSLLDGHQMNLDLGESFYKRLFYRDLDSQLLSMHDLKDVVPALDNFIRDLYEAWAVKKRIDENELLTADEKAKAVSRIACGRCTFEDMCITFTVPGYSHIEMKEGGRDVFLTAENVDEYIRLLVWWTLHRGPRDKFKSIREGLDRVIPVDYFRWFYPHEFRSLFCGDDCQKWTVEYLKEHCLLTDGLTADTPVVRHLFQVLSSLSDDEQKKFLQFVTSRPRLPSGGLAGLWPRLTIGRQRAYYDPDAYVPSARTCFNALYITDYSSEEILREKLARAIDEGSESFHFV